MDERPRHVRFLLVELIFLVVNGEAVQEGHRAKIREAAGRGWWLIAREAVTGWEAHRETAVAVLGLLASDEAERLQQLLPTAMDDSR